MAIVTSLVAPNYSAGVLFDSKKGSIENRLECGAEHIKNNAQAALKTALVGTTAAGLTYAVHKNAKAAQYAQKGMKAVQGLLNKNKTGAKVAGKIAHFLSKFSTAGKVGVITAAIALPILAYINNQHTYKAGQIDQKYNDRAAVQNQLDNFISLEN